MIAFASQDLGLRPAQWKAVARKATRAGKTAPEYLRLLIEQDLLAENTFEDLLRPIRRDFRNSGMTQARLDVILRRARGAHAPERRKTNQAKSGTPRR